MRETDFLRFRTVHRDRKPEHGLSAQLPMLITGAGVQQATVWRVNGGSRRRTSLPLVRCLLAEAIDLVRSFKSLLRFAARPVGASILMASFNFAVCYFRSFIFPGVPIVIWGDQLGYFTAGSRIVSGQLPYRDYLQIVPPGTDLVYAVLIKCFGEQTWVPNLLMACLAAMTALLMTLIASRLMCGAVILLPGLLLAGFVLLASMDATHHWFSTIAILAAVLVLLQGTTWPRVSAAGAFCGLAGCFTQTKGCLAVAGFLVYVVYSMRRLAVPASERWQQCLLLCGSATVVFAAANAYFIWAASFSRWLFCVLVYPLRYYPSPSINNWRVLLYDFGWHRGIGRWVSFPFIYATVPLVYIVFIATWRRWSEDQDESWRKLLLVAIAGLAMFTAIASAPSAKRLCTVSPPAMILLAWLLNRPAKVAAGYKVLLASAAAVLAIAVPAYVQTRWHQYLDLPAGRSAFLDPVLYDEYRWILGNTRPGQYFFGLPPLYPAFHMRNPAAIEGVDPSEYTRPQQVIALVDALEDHRVPLLVLRQSRDLLYPKGSQPDHLEPFRAYVTQNYRLTKTFPTRDDVWQRLESPKAPDVTSDGHN